MPFTQPSHITESMVQGYQMEKNGRWSRQTSPETVLGLLAMGENRGTKQGSESVPMETVPVRCCNQILHTTVEMTKGVSTQQQH